MSPDLSEEFKLSLFPPITVKGCCLKCISVLGKCGVFLKMEFVVWKVKGFQVCLALEIHVVGCPSFL